MKIETKLPSNVYDDTGLGKVDQVLAKLDGKISLTEWLGKVKNLVEEHNFDIVVVVEHKDKNKVYKIMKGRVNYVS